LLVPLLLLAQLRSLPSRLLLLTTVLHHSLLLRNPLVKVQLTICPSKEIGYTKNKPKARVDAQVLGFILFGFDKANRRY
jgi:hypothetical protein